MRSPACFVTVALAMLGPAGCRPAGSPTAQPDPQAARTSEPTPSDQAVLPTATADSTPSAVEADDPTPSPTPSAPGLIEQLWAHYDAGALSPEAIDSQLQPYLDEHPDDPSALLLLAWIRIEEGRYDEALAAADRCLVLSPDSARCWHAVGLLGEALGSIERALEGYRKYLELAPDDQFAPSARRAVRRLEGRRGHGS
jgi:tetratricopeptide (TPR) repeat protein